ncbi:MAG: hypothetical protein H0W25_16110 [Acidimicrobiia bacterium]|nr:hypothetical protein [Acidimicrobiia bacterium]
MAIDLVVEACDAGLEVSAFGAVGASADRAEGVELPPVAAASGFGVGGVLTLPNYLILDPGVGVARVVGRLPEPGS